jgi:3-phenylpropionate/trans-cinnamate dioxygenase ferredoxin reductase subunit
MTKRVLILGAGHAGGTAAALLRQYGFDGEIVLAGEEPVLPYQRPPLSKAWLKGEADAEALELKPAEFYAQQKIDVRTGVVAVRINREAKTVRFVDGETLDYDILILATGARARWLDVPGSDLSGLLALRSQADAEALKAGLKPGARLAIVGGGYVGLEVAASARALGCEVAVLEREPRILARVASAPLSEFFTSHHRDHGVEIITGCSVTGFSGNDGRINAVELADGRTIPCDLAVVGVGAVANVELAKDAGLPCADGVIVDLAARTADPFIYAIGDVTHRPLLHYRRDMRLESVPNALEQAKQAVSAILGRPAPTPEVPWFWSDQYDLKLQIAGVPFDADTLVIRKGQASNALAVFHLREGRVQAVEAVNSPPEFMGGRVLIAKGQEVDPQRLGDPSIPMKALMAG